MAKRFRIQHIDSARQLAQARSTVRAQGTVVLANPAFGARKQSSGQPDTTLPAFGPLPGTALEATSIQSVLGENKVDVHMGPDANESVLRALRSPQILHIATHGFSRPSQAAASDPMLDSGLALAHYNDQKTKRPLADGLLSALEATMLDLRGTEVVVLSACETSLGDVEPGEGLNGLQRALSISGAASSMTSLWKVDDLATAALMAGFYRRLVAGDSRTEALRAVQLDMAEGRLRPNRADLASRGVTIASSTQDTKADWRHPYYWAGFVLSGRDGPFNSKPKTSKALFESSF